MMKRQFHQHTVGRVIFNDTCQEMPFINA